MMMMMLLPLVRVVLAAIAVASCAGPTGPAGTTGAMDTRPTSNPATSGPVIREAGSLHVGGRQVTLSGLPVKEVAVQAGTAPIRLDPNGDFEVDQMYVQYIRLASPRARHPLLMWHGGGLSGVTWETKPDGQPGWQQFFLAAGHDVYVSDAVERGRASWARYPEINPIEPLFRTKKEAWEAFRIGGPDSYQTDPARRVAYPDGQFPVQAFDQFAKQFVPRWTTSDRAIEAAYEALILKVCPCVILLHSQAGVFASRLALKHPDRVKGVVAIEPFSAPDPASIDPAQLARLAGVPFLFVWGDRIDTPAFWRRSWNSNKAFADALARGGARVEWWDLPARGIRGNDHMLMMNRNSDQIAALIQAWMDGAGLMK
jgi:pimeloyl-ACP methyl ester carboxylesterase